MDSCLHVVRDKFWPNHLTVTTGIKTQQTNIVSNPLQLCKSCAKCCFTLADRRSNVLFCWCSPSASRLRVMCLLHASVVTSGYLSHCCILSARTSLAIVLWPHQQSVFFPREPQLSWYLHIFWTFPCKPRWLCVKITDQQFLKYLNYPVHIHGRFKVA